MTQHDRRGTITKVMNQKVSFRRTGEGLLQGIMAFAMYVGLVTLGLIVCLLYCPREHMASGLILALLLFPGVAGLSLCVLLQARWWRRYQSLHPAVRHRGCGMVLFFLAMIVIGSVLLFDQLFYVTGL